eukprot:TRINITY_DN9379_c0_g1_i1.p1 TRINITY_DN9379_c0_g1~~TRINITY_DN9379_c0_g1_i1.p1  ORF type:complete len:562 (-),score=218.46 TRINITY_DN9379_c0_g1_i1:33-1577(-)
MFRTNDDPIRIPDQQSIYNRAKFARGVQDLGITLTKILGDTMNAIKLEHQADFETVADLFFQIAKGYTHTPDLRLDWLTRLAKKHSDVENFPEAGMCYLHLAALVADHLQHTGALNLDNSVFKQISPSIAEFANPDEEGACESAKFCRRGLVNLLKTSIEWFEGGELFELAAAVHKILIPIYENENEYRQLFQGHQKLASTWEQVHQFSVNEQRLFGTYFRVGFHGEPLGPAVDAREYVYKLPKLFHLYDLSARFKAHFGKQFGEDNVIVLQDSNVPDRSKFEKGKIYLQLTHVERYFSQQELEKRNTHFARSTKISHFIYSAPFTKAGGPRADGVSGQWIRKTVLTTEAPFPYMLTRLAVTEKRTIEMSPIECSIEAIEQRTATLMSEVNKKPQNLKTLQQVLQGTVRLQVNQGAMEIVRVFVGNYAEFPIEMVNSLVAQLRLFLNACHQLLQIDQALGPENDPLQESFHNEMIVGYNDLYKEMNEYLKKFEDFRDNRAPLQMSVSSFSTFFL